MLSRISRFFLIFLTGALSACGGGGGSDGGSGAAVAPAPLAEWTYMVYMAGDNNLSAAAIADINEMEVVGSSSQVNVVVQAEFSLSHTPDIPGLKGRDGISIGIPIGGVMPGQIPTVRGRISRDFDTGYISSPLKSAGANLDMGKAQTLEDFIRWSAQNYPARHYALVLWSHGDGWKVKRDVGGVITKGALADDTSGTFMSVPDIAKAVKDSGVRPEVLNFDACLMAMYEVAHALTGLADYLVASEELEPSEGDDYTALLGELQGRPSMTAPELGKAMARTYRAYYAGDTTFRDDAVTKSVIRLGAIPALQVALEDMASYAVTHLSAHRIALQAARAASVAYDNRHSHDLGDFLTQLESQPSVAADTVFRARIAAVRSALADTVVDNRVYATEASSAINRSQGLAIFLPHNSQVTQDELDAYGTLSAHQNGKTAWRSLINQLVTGEDGGLLEKVDGNFSFTIRWNNPTVDMDLYVNEPDGELYAPYMDSQTQNGFFSPDSSAGEVNSLMENYTARDRIQKGEYHVFVHYYDGIGSTEVRFYYADAETPETLEDVQVMPVSGLPFAPVSSFPLTDANIAAGKYADWWYPGGLDRYRAGPAGLSRTFRLPEGRQVTVHFQQRRAKLKQALAAKRGH